MAENERVAVGFWGRETRIIMKNEQYLLFNVYELPRLNHMFYPEQVIPEGDLEVIEKFKRTLEMNKYLSGLCVVSFLFFFNRLRAL